jgi:hypothetical protein
MSLAPLAESDSWVGARVMVLEVGSAQEAVPARVSAPAVVESVPCGRLSATVVRGTFRTLAGAYRGAFLPGVASMVAIADICPVCA